MTIDNVLSKKKLKSPVILMSIVIGICLSAALYFLFQGSGEEERSAGPASLKEEAVRPEITVEEQVAERGGIVKNVQPVSIGETFTITSTVLGSERRIIVYLPDGYRDTFGKYHVLYVLDGQWHFRSAVGIVHFLSGSSYIPQMLVVAVTNEGIRDRDRDFLPASSSNESPGGRAPHFLSFLKKELIPYIENNYRTYPYRVLAGHSYGGLFTVYSLLEEPGLFDAYIAISPSLWWKGGIMAKKAETFFSKHPRLNKTLIMTMCDEGELMRSSMRKFEKAVRKRTPTGFRFYTRYMDDEDKDDHITTNIRSRALALRRLYRNWQLPDPVIEKGLMSMKTHIIKLSKELGYNIVIPEYLGNKMGYEFIYVKEYKKAINLFRYNAQLYPDSANVYDSLGEAYMLDGQYELARKNYAKSLELDPGNEKTKEKLRQLEPTRAPHHNKLVLKQKF